MKTAALKVGPVDAPSATSSPQASQQRGTPRGKVSPAPLLAAAPLMTRNEVAAILRTTPRQISNMTARGQLPAPVRVAGLGLRWRRPEIDAWIAAQ